MPQLLLAPSQVFAGSYTLKEGTTSLGRESDNDICVPHESLSRRHATVEVTAAGAFVEDRGSKNGTYLNDERITRAALAPGDRLRMGAIIFLFDPPANHGALVPRVTAPTSMRFSRDDLRHLLDARPSNSGNRLRAVPGVSRSEQRLQLLLRLSHLLSGHRTLDELFAAVLDLSFEIFDIDRAALLVANAKGVLEPQAQRVNATVSAGASGSDRAFAEEVRKQGVAALFSDAADSSPEKSAPLWSSMVAPLKPHETVLGVLCVDNFRTAGLFTQDDLELLAAFASQAGVAFENARLALQLEQEAVVRSRLLRFFPPSTAARLLADGGDALPMLDTIATALFCDISGFAALTERMAPAEVMELLNGYFPTVADVALRLEGTLEKYIGDALLVVWGAPYPRPDHAAQALRAALEMQRAIETFNAKRVSTGWRAIQIHIGLHTGRIAAGTIGTEQFLQYATIGDTTNVAARLCDLAGPGEIVLSEATHAGIPDPPCPLKEWRRQELKGRTEQMLLYRVSPDDQSTVQAPRLKIAPSGPRGAPGVK